MKYILISKLNNKVKAISNGKIKFDKNKFYFKKITFTKEEKQKIQNGFKIYFKNNKLEFVESNLLKKDNLKQEIDKADNIDKLKKIIKELI